MQKLIACKTCLQHFNLTDKIEVGVVGTTMDIVELQKMADKVITL
ncbi:MAG: DsrE family protein [Salinivirgaceae bacterium]|nr:DsrE family protein [Salinivirgaceae bacterium]